ncbi:Sec-independent protein translocase protein TatB [Phenylobacterium sp.]|jgi:sec-independent protein translocase protein TatB|uniref:Sec-independent protein translocase protein TatB n=1 Tax=Phenylobacterium sp. TaxID=1871053 RepID=UPI002E379922|nr:Sec-independent protein translocase protein TatB [Phenylobacterium sp.]HEX2560723.1 Sec-independent protein translocase protein TatB [Phenylobacterium sp.]
MLDLGIGAAELMLIAAVALIVVGPKDLPLLMRRIGQFTGRMRAMAAEFRSSFDEMARQSELDELRKQVEAMRRGQLLDDAAGKAEMEQVFSEIDEGLKADEGMVYRGHEYAEPAPLPAAEPESEAAAAPKRRARKPKSEVTIAPAEAAAPKRARKPRAPKAGQA